MEDKQQLLFRAMQSAKLQELAELKGGTGHLRKPLSVKEEESRRIKRKQAKMSRKANR
ncbi:hypothetical protein [Bacillus sp. 03113]|uniref:hypothetical protein n=1 Tax=Bacillus sp. 03113 TaxID=2578211 RepID=UPI0015E8DBF5|nr:hypothetical protein [Bacillus sp. 03113]